MNKRLTSKSVLMLLAISSLATSVYADTGFALVGDSYRETTQKTVVSSGSKLYNIKSDYMEKIEGGSTNEQGDPQPNPNASDGEYQITTGDYGEEVVEKTTIPNNQTVRVSKETVDKLINYIVSKQGNNYSWGGTNVDVAYDPDTYNKNPKTDGTDCSGMVIAAYKFIGYNFEAGRINSSSIKTSVGKEVSQAEMQPGDLLYFSHGHVAMYIGDGKVINAEGDDTTAGQIYVRNLKGDSNQYYLWSTQYPVACVKRVLEIDNSTN